MKRYRVIKTTIHKVDKDGVELFEKEYFETQKRHLLVFWRNIDRKTTLREALRVIEKQKEKYIVEREILYSQYE